MSWSPTPNALLIRFLLKDFLQTDQKTVSLVGIQAEQIIRLVWRIITGQQVYALVAHDEEVIRWLILFIQNDLSMQ